MTLVVPDLSVVTVDVDARHDAAFTIDRPHGTADWTLLHLVTQATVRDRHGRQDTRADACILISPGSPQWLAARGGEFNNHYAHLNGAAMAPLVACLGLPVDEILYPRPSGFMREQLAELRQIWSGSEPDAHIQASFVVGRLLGTLARRLRAAPASAPSVAGRSLHERLHQIRRWVVESPGRQHSAAWMAQQAGVSASYLSASWRRTFGVTPQEDLITIRLESACRLLEGAALPVAQVAERCGFADAHYFSRLFRQRLGCTPSAYARRQTSPDPGDGTLPKRTRATSDR